MSDPSAPPEDVDSTATAALRTLATRLLEMQYPLADQAPIRLVVGQVAPEFPSEVPLPDGSHVLGTLVGKRRVIVLFEVDLPLERFDAYYHERLPAVGWSLAEPRGPARGGFVHTRPPGPPSVGALYCRGEAGPGVVVSASRLDDAASTLTQASLQLMHYEKPQESPCARRQLERLGRMERGRWETLFPTLQAPPGGTQEGGGSGGGGSYYTTTATLDVIGLDAETVGRHYIDQLTQGGWMRTDEGAVYPAAWSTWTFTDEQAQRWTALFFALRHPAMAGRYLLTLRADLIESGQT